jgi:hypothetical protein
MFRKVLSSSLSPIRFDKRAFRKALSLLCLSFAISCSIASKSKSSIKLLPFKYKTVPTDYKKYRLTPTVSGKKKTKSKIWRLNLSYLNPSTARKIVYDQPIMYSIGVSKKPLALYTPYKQK